MRPSDSAPVGFPSTLWSVIREAGGDAARRDALGRLIERYWKPAYWYIRLAHGREPAAAMDLTQAFFLHVLESDFAANVAPGRGRFRSFLKASIRNFVVNDALAARAAKRGGPLQPLSADQAESGAAELLAAGRTLGPDQVFEREWRSAVVRNAAEEVRRRLEADGKKTHFEIFRLHDLEGSPPPAYRDLAARFSVSEDDVRNHLRVAREIFRDCVRREVRETVDSPAEEGEELRELFGDLR